MKFFVPFYRDETKAENLYKAIRKHAHDMLGWEISERRIYSLKYLHDGKTYDAIIGEKDPERIGEPIMAILKLRHTSFAHTIMVLCVANRHLLDCPMY